MTSEVLKNEQVDKVKLVKAAYIKSFIGSVVVVLIGLVTSMIINRYFPFTPIIINLLQAFSIVPGSAALFGAQGWNIQTWSGRIPAESLNQKIFRFLSIIGLFFAVVAFSLSSESIRETPSIENAISLTQT
jgi:hypothetical protein